MVILIFVPFIFSSPSVNPEKEITDPNDKKPADWDERERFVQVVFIDGKESEVLRL